MVGKKLKKQNAKAKNIRLLHHCFSLSQPCTAFVFPPCSTHAFTGVVKPQPFPQLSPQKRFFPILQGSQNWPEATLKHNPRAGACCRQLFPEHWWGFSGLSPWCIPRAKPHRTQLAAVSFFPLCNTLLQNSSQYATLKALFSWNLSLFPSPNTFN